MDPAKVSQWLRFRDQVLQKQGWPREVWFTAFEDGLHAAFGDDAPVLADFRRDRAELLRLEGRASGSYQDAQRIAQLEAQLRQLVDRADRSVTAGQTDAAEPDPVASLPPAALAAVPALAVPAIARAQPWRARAAMMAAGSVLVALGVGGASLYYETRLSALADQQIAQIDRLLDQRVAGLRAELEQQLASGSGKDSAVAGELRARTTALGGALDELSLEVSSLEMRLPALDKELNKISASAGRMAQELTRTGSEVDRLKTATPELRAWLAQQKEELEKGVQGGHDTLGGITGRVQAWPARSTNRARCWSTSTIRWSRVWNRRGRMVRRSRRRSSRCRPSGSRSPS
jgi:hypothetical protein